MWSRFTADTIYLDANIIIYAIESGNRWNSILRGLFEAIDDRSIRAVTSELTIAEVLVKPIEMNAEDLIERYEQVLSRDSPIHVIPIDRAILKSAAALQARLRVKLADAIHLATATAHSCDYILSNDERLGHKLSHEFRWLPLTEIGRA